MRRVKEMALLFVVVGVAQLGVKINANQSETNMKENQPIGELENGRVETPEVVLQLKYDGGALDRIYLAQYRQGKKIWIPSVQARNSLCSDLCHSGLGGQSCGSSCQDLVPVGLQSTLHQYENSSEVIEQVEGSVGIPRRYVCPALCANKLGEPLCNCEYDIIDNETPNWDAVCSAFCQDGAYVLPGCPACSSVADPNGAKMRILSTTDGWAAWCNVQCRQGHGGAACNCDRAPFQ